MSSTIAGKPCGSIGLGMMRLTIPPHLGTTTPLADAIATLKAALEAGSNFWDAGTNYGTADYNSLHLLKAYFSRYPEDADKVVISVKSCFDVNTRTSYADATRVKADIETCLKIIDGTFKIAVFQAARLDPDIPVEETVGAIAEYVKSGRLGGVGLSECSANSIRKAVAVHPIAAVEVELGLFETSPLHNGIVEACSEFGITIIAYSPLGRGFLTGQWKKYEDVPKNDFRLMFPRFQPSVFDENMKLVREVEKIAQRKGRSIAQVAIAWVSALSDVVGTPVIPIPSISSQARVEENMQRIRLTPAEMDELNTVLQAIEVKGERYPAPFMKWTSV